MSPQVIAAIITGACALAAGVLAALINSERLIVPALGRWKKKLPSGFLIFINGGSGVGKSSLAWALARRLNVASVVGVDIIREALRPAVASGAMNDMKVLLESSYTANAVLGVPTVEAFRKQCELLVPAIIRVSHRVRARREPTIIEGVNLVASELFKTLPVDRHSKVIFINLHITEDSRHLARLRQRGEESSEPPERTDRYVAHLADIRTIDRFLAEDAGAVSGRVPVVLSLENSGSLSKTLRSAVKHINAFSGKG